MEIYAKAKINLGLDVLGLRPDGYHDICTVMQTISLYDIIHIEPAPHEGSARRPEIHFTADSPQVPSDSSNLVYRAAGLLMEEFGLNQALNIHLEKKIPVGAGMGGGSTDAAATLRGLNELFALGLTDDDLMKRAARLGADVPFCVMGGTALAEGIGEILTPLPPLAACHFLIAKPPVSVSTKEAYGQLDTGRELKHPDMKRTIAAVRGADLHELAASLSNIFEPGIRALHPEVGELAACIRSQGALTALMTGSGPTVFGIFESADTALRARKTMSERFPQAFLCIAVPDGAK